MLAGLLRSEDVALDVVAPDMQALFAAIGELMWRNHALDPKAVALGLAARERVGSTALGQGVAIPHARLGDLRCPVLAYLRLRHPLHCDTPDGHPVVDVFSLLVPEPATREHLEMLAEVAQGVSDPAFRQRLHEQADARMVWLDLTRRFDKLPATDWRAIPLPDCSFKTDCQARSP